MMKGDLKKYHAAMAHALAALPDGSLPIQNNLVYWFPLTYDDQNGNPVSAPAGDVDTVAAGGTFAASLTFAIGTMPSGPLSGASAVSATAQVVESDAGNSGGRITLLITDSAGLTEDSATSGLFFDIIVPPPVPTTVGVQPSGVVTVANPTPPTAAGP
jgi:hypothetical protein